MKKNILFYNNCWNDLRFWRDKFVIPVINEAVRQLGSDYNISFMYNEKTEAYADIVDAATQCQRNNSAMFFVPPDTVFGVDSIVNIIRTFNEEPYFVAIPHLRVNRETYQPGVWNNKQLCTYSVKHLHPSAELSKTKHDGSPNLSHMGITIRTGAENFLVYNHCLPTVYYCGGFDEADMVALRNTYQNKYNWDSVFLAHLYRTNKVRVIGSSDFACCFESTNRDSNSAVPRVNVGDEYKHKQEHNVGLGKFLYCLNY